jgi:hypothetical protein
MHVHGVLMRMKAPDATVTHGYGAGRGRPPEAAARRAGLEDVEKVPTDNIDAANKTA